jgi:acyl carrier protein
MEAMNDVKGRLRSYVEENFLMGARPAPLADDDSFLEHHVLDSTGFLELVTFVEETYGVKVEEDEMIPENLDSLNSLTQFLARKGVA